MSGNDKEYKNIVLEDLEQSERGKSLEEIDRLSDIKLPVRVEFSRIKKSLEEVIDIAEGDVVKLNRFAGEHVDIYVDEKLFGKGEITVVEDKFGIRIVEILPPGDRLG